MVHMDRSQMLKTNLLRRCQLNTHHDDNHKLNAACNQPPQNAPRRNQPQRKEELNQHPR